MRRGFTLIELLIVIAIVSLAASAVIFTIDPARRGGQARDAIRKSNLAQIYNALIEYELEHGTFPLGSTGPDFASNSEEAGWLSELVPRYLKTLPSDPKNTQVMKTTEGSVASATIPPKNRTYQMKVLVLKYFPTADGVNLNSNITGITSSLTNIRTTVNNIKNETLSALEDGSKYHGYNNPLATPGMDYSIYDEKEFLATLPLGNQIGPNLYRPNYMQILQAENICDLVENQGVREVWLFGWHHGNIEPVESNMAGPQGDISNSEGTNDMPTCAKTYVLYNYNYGRSSGEAVHNHGHQIEVVLKRFGDPLFENRFIGPFQAYGSNDGSGANFHRCGWTHVPPNTSGDYDYSNNRSSWTDCEDWKPDGSGNKVNITCSRWQCDQRRYHTWRWQGMPGRDNAIPGASNWWDFIGDLDSAVSAGQQLVYDIEPPTKPQNLTSSDVYSTRVTLNWNASTDDFGVTAYIVKRDGDVIGSSQSTTFTDYTASQGSFYEYTVMAQDAEGNQSQDSDPVGVNTTSSPPPAATTPVLDQYSYKVGSSSSSYSWLHNVGNGQQRFLIVGVGMRSGGGISVSNVTYKGINLTKLSERANGGLKTEFWTLKNPDFGLNTITVTMSGAPWGSVSGASSWFFVDQTNPVGPVASRTGLSTNPNVDVTTSATDKVVDVAVMPNTLADISTPGAGQVAFWNSYSPGDTKGMGSAKTSSGATTRMEWTTKNEVWSMMGVSLKLSSEPPIIIEPPSSPLPSPSPIPTAGCPDDVFVYCYVVTEDGRNFIIWTRLEDTNDLNIWNKSGARCVDTPPNDNYNYCIRS